MASIIPNPDNIPGAVSSGYQRQNTLIFASMVGFCNINMSTTGIISRGSIIEINGSLARSFDNESVSNLGSIPNNSVLYIYAVPINEKEVVYQASTNIPSWNTEKCGWYYNANRAVIRATKDANGVISGVTKMSDILNSDIPSNSGGTLIYSRNYRSSDRIVVNAGWYRFEMASGLGKGNGGNGGPNNSVYDTGAGAAGVPSTSSYRSAVFNHQGGEILIHVGGNGYNGEAGGVGNRTSNSGGGGGGGAGAGEETFIITGSSIYTTGKVESGKGGDGASVGSINPNAGGKGTYFGLTGEDGQGGTYESGSDGTHHTEGGAGGAGFDSPNEGYGGCGGGGGGGNSSGGSGGNYGRGGAGGGVLTGAGNPGWARQWGDYAAGYCNIYQL